MRAVEHDDSHIKALPGNWARLFFPCPFSDLHRLLRSYPQVCVRVLWTISAATKKRSPPDHAKYRLPGFALPGPAAK